MKLKANHPNTCAQSFDFSKIKAVFVNLENRIDQLQEIHQHIFNDRSIAAISLIHRSAMVFWPKDKTGLATNERLEFLGDAILTQFVSKAIFFQHPEWSEGTLSRFRAAIVGAENLAKKCRHLQIDQLLLVGKGEQIDQRKGNLPTSVLANAFEASIAARLIDAGEQATEKWLSSIFVDEFANFEKILDTFDAKTRFQEWVQSVTGHAPVYRTVNTTESSDRCLQFTVAAFVRGTEIGRASGKNKKEVSVAISRDMLQKIESGSMSAESLLKLLEGGENR